ncbi:hypothetical protein NEUTE1DRAFT_109379 [Neurospora tetrasperma FGSC 2508]|uniref:Secreted protein n=1 Tax=Neurospora tetrasperma (strain FGSC 2508 / ATCC MYA-4615 / P0657) TaxID=510951 RepID=F8MJ85_NEUT8|nr:uncharacterized protein NEUTE1DRAFT_109379 [Neurospora tetrasperma FGSC 2508]EGO59929.1 hypothetical protein NEUTE1DRAFT_109379 [Neurospora tetrasperma FGSC 2508]EGZ74079.1 hypothetical protein NEUTE2DRAFT_138310 [Neurospora tetrasperma FGSC 2509]
MYVGDPGVRWCCLLLLLLLLLLILGAVVKGGDADSTVVDSDNDADDAAAAAADDDGGDDYMPASPITSIDSDVPKLPALLDNQHHRTFPLEIDRGNHTFHQDQETTVPIGRMNLGASLRSGNIPGSWTWRTCKQK